MQTLYLIRHGESTANVQGIFASHRLDVPLTSGGITQANELASYLNAQAPTRILTSPSIRAKDTAAIIADECSAILEISDDLREVDVGSLEGRSETDPGASNAYTTVIKSWQAGQTQTSFEQGESLEAVGLRLLSLLHKVEHLTDESIVLVGHGLLFACFVLLFDKHRNQSIEENFLDCGTFARVSFDFSNERIMSYTFHSPHHQVGAP